ncbi:Neuromedin-U Receptor 2 [Manis pentadactyla]|nr:Neuromedin-U Receptor 2 [Manis pentadactyla]
MTTRLPVDTFVMSAGSGHCLHVASLSARKIEVLCEPYRSSRQRGELWTVSVSGTQPGLDPLLPGTQVQTFLFSTSAGLTENIISKGPCQTELQENSLKSAIEPSPDRA